MKLRKIFGALVLTLFSFGPAICAPGSAPSANMYGHSETPATSRSEELLKRLEEIKGMDVKSMSKAQKRELRKEVHGIKKEMKTLDGGGVYISIGALLIIIILILII